LVVGKLLIARRVNTEENLWDSTYSRSKGVFADLTLESAVVEQDNDSTRAIYGKHMSFATSFQSKRPLPEAPTHS